MDDRKAQLRSLWDVCMNRAVDCRLSQCSISSGRSARRCNSSMLLVTVIEISNHTTSLSNIATAMAVPRIQMIPKDSCSPAFPKSATKIWTLSTGYACTYEPLVCLLCQARLAGSLGAGCFVQCCPVRFWKRGTIADHHREQTTEFAAAGRGRSPFLYALSCP